jgi:hypothetical protein
MSENTHVLPSQAWDSPDGTNPVAYGPDRMSCKSSLLSVHVLDGSSPKSFDLVPPSAVSIMGPPSPRIPEATAAVYSTQLLDAPPRYLSDGVDCQMNSFLADIIAGASHLQGHLSVSAAGPTMDFPFPTIEVHMGNSQA